MGLRILGVKDWNAGAVSLVVDGLMARRGCWGKMDLSNDGATAMICVQ